MFEVFEDADHAHYSDSFREDVKTPEDFAKALDI